MNKVLQKNGSLLFCFQGERRSERIALFIIEKYFKSSGFPIPLDDDVKVSEGRCETEECFRIMNPNFKQGWQLEEHHAKDIVLNS